MDGALAGLLAAATFVVHSPHYLLSAPFWIDESWVAVSTRLPLHDAPHVTSSSPLGWTLLVRAFPFGGEQGSRLLPLVFSALSVAVAYFVGRSLAWKTLWQSRVAGSLAALAVLLAPSSLLRDDLKAYTTDAFVALVLLLLVSRLEASWTRQRLRLFCAIGVAGFLFSIAALFVVIAAFAALLAVQARRRDWARALEVAIAGALTAVVLGVVFLLLYRPHVESSLTQFWAGYFVPIGKGLGPTMTFLYDAGLRLAKFLGMGPLLVVALLIVAGMVTLARWGRPVIALTLPVLMVEMVGLGAVRKYPLLDDRTSYFLTAMCAVFAAIGVAGLCFALARRSVVASAVVLALVAVGFTANVWSGIRAHTLPDQDVRTATAYVAAHERPGDIILVSGPANWGFAYYWPKGTAAWRRSVSTVATGFQTWFPDQPNIIFTADRDWPSIAHAYETASRKANETGARIWVVRMAVGRAENFFWKRAVAQHRVKVERIVTCSLMLVSVVPAASVRTPANLNAMNCIPTDTTP